MCYRIMKNQGPPRHRRPGMRQPERSVLLDLFQHLEDALRRADEHALKSLGQATTLERVAAGTGTFGHGKSLTVGAGGGHPAKSRYYTVTWISVPCRRGIRPERARTNCASRKT